MKRIERFFCYCAGVSQSLLNRCPTETSKYVSIGATVFFTGLMAAISSAYAFYFIFDAVTLPILLGSVWGLMIFNLDRLIVLSLRKSLDGKREYLQAIPRILLATLIALVIAKPLELKIFEKEINAELLLMKEELKLEQEQLLAQRFEYKLDSLNQLLVSMDAALLTKQNKRDELLDLARQEADGTGGSGKVNPGPIYQIKKKNADLAQTELDELRASIASRTPKIEKQIMALNELKNSQINALEPAQINGVLFQLTALDRLGNKYQSILLANLFIVLLFIVLELLPIISKIMSPRGPYDDLLLVHEMKFESNRKQKVHVAEKEVEQLMMT